MKMLLDRYERGRMAMGLNGMALKAEEKFNTFYSNRFEWSRTFSGHVGRLRFISIHMIASSQKSCTCAPCLPPATEEGTRDFTYNRDVGLQVAQVSYALQYGLGTDGNGRLVVKKKKNQHTRSDTIYTYGFYVMYTYICINTGIKQQQHR